jgi:ketose-bisphosphate aldolase
MLVSLKEVLTDARAGGYAVPAFDCTEDLLVRPILDACEAARSPVILMALEHDLGGRGFDYIASLVRGVAGAYSIPIVLHLDHSTDFAMIEKAIAHGFTSVMFDGSALPFAENAAISRRVADYAHQRGVDVEAELGKVAGVELDGRDGGESLLTEPGEVVEFLALTGVDALAVSIGTAHGVYTSAPKLDIPRMRAINTVSSVPLVLHGGSGTPTDQIRAAIGNGIAKVNLYSDIRAALLRGLRTAVAAETRTDPLPDALFAPAKAEVAAAVRGKLAMVLSEGRAR